jgi:hypothetical protein
VCTKPKVQFILSLFRSVDIRAHNSPWTSGGIYMEAGISYMRDEVIVKSSGESLEVHITVGEDLPFSIFEGGGFQS